MAPVSPHPNASSDEPTVTRHTSITLDPLPSEIKRLILDQVILSSSQSELLPLPRTCSSLYVESAPLVYKEVVLDTATRAKSFFAGIQRPKRDGLTGPYPLDDLSTRRAELLKLYAHPALEGYPPIKPKYILLGLVRKLVIGSYEAAHVAWLAAKNEGYVGRESMEKDKQHLFVDGLQNIAGLLCDGDWLLASSAPDHKLFSGLECLLTPGRWEHVVLHNVQISRLSVNMFNTIYAGQVTIYAAPETDISNPSQPVNSQSVDPVDKFIVNVVLADEHCCVPSRVSRLTFCDLPRKPLWNYERMQQWAASERWEGLKDGIVMKEKSESSCCEGCGNKVLPWAPKVDRESGWEFGL
ncbi:hypothetical protein IAT38_005425 [Cryptococcus sp. DSM 104549]